MGNTVFSMPVRRPAVAGGFYPAEPEELARLLTNLLVRATSVAPALTPDARALVGILVPHAGLVYSGLVAATGWRCLERLERPAPTIVLLGTNHVAGWLHGVGAWDTGTWRTPLGSVGINSDLVAAIVSLGPPFVVDRAAHDDEHSIEVQLPFVQTLMPTAQIVPLAVASGTGATAVDAGHRLGELLAERRRTGESIVLAISSDMAHYPSALACSAATEALLPPLVALDALGLARAEADLRHAKIPGLVCGMCGIEPTVLGLAALKAMGVSAGTRIASATSADAGGPQNRTVGYLAVGFEA